MSGHIRSHDVYVYIQVLFLGILMVVKETSWNVQNLPDPDSDPDSESE